MGIPYNLSPMRDDYNVLYLVILHIEQYDAFVKFSHDQVERRLAESAFSCELHG